MNYNVIYSVNYFNMPIIVYVTLVITISIVVFLIRKHKDIENRKIIRGVIPAGFFVGIFAIASVYSYLNNIHSLKAGNYKVIEGKVESFSPAASSYKGIESFQVNSKTFEYSYSSINGGLNHSVFNIEGMKNGSMVRVCYKNNTILRLEVRK